MFNTTSKMNRADRSMLDNRMDLVCYVHLWLK